MIKCDFELNMLQIITLNASYLSVGLRYHILYIYIYKKLYNNYEQKLKQKGKKKKNQNEK